MMKFAFFLVVAICAFQGYEARSVAANEVGLDGPAEIIGQIIQYLKDKITDLIKTIKDTIGDAAEKLQGLIDNIKKIVKENADKGKKCLEEQRPAMDALEATIYNGMKSCKDKAVADAADIQEKLIAIEEKSKETIKDIVNRVKNCFHGGIASIIACLKKENAPIREMISETLGEINVTIKLAEGKALDAVNCVRAVEEDATTMQKKIVEDLLECVKQ